LGLMHNVPSIQSSPIGRTPLIMCTFIEDDHWSYNIAQNLIEKGGIVGRKDHNGLNALMYACLNQKLSLFKLYAKTVGDYSLTSTDNFSNTVMHMASLSPNESMCLCLQELCFKYGLNVLQLKNKFGHTPYDLCLLMNHRQCLSNYAIFKKLESKSDKNLNSTSEPLFNSFSNLSPSPNTGFARTQTNFSSYQSNESPRPDKITDSTSLLRRDLVDFYKQIYTIREKFIKTNHIFDHPESFLKKSHTPTLLDLNKPKPLLCSSNNQKPIGSSVSKTTQRVTSTLRTNSKKQTWRSDIKKMFANLEQQNTDSYRKTQHYTVCEMVSRPMLNNLDVNKPLINCRRGSTMVKENPMGRRMSVVNRGAFSLANKAILIS
jgi:hypothetical protein